MENLSKQIVTIYPFSEADLEKILSKFKSNSYKAKDNILVQGQVATDVHFIEEGLVRVFYLKDGTEITTYLSTDDGVVSSYSSFINQTKSFENIQCLEETTTYSISFKDMHELYEKVPQWQIVGRFLAEQNVLCLADRILKLQSIPAKKKYADFLKTTHPKIIKRTPLIHIATYLGITPESLSRIRKHIS